VFVFLKEQLFFWGEKKGDTIEFEYFPFYPSGR